MQQLLHLMPYIITGIEYNRKIIINYETDNKACNSGFLVVDSAQIKSYYYYEELHQLETSIEDFLATRKANKLKKEITSALTIEEKVELEASIEAMFTLKNWLPNAASRASQLSLVSHPAKFTHPSAKTTPVIFDGEFRPDGYLRSGNVKVDLDAFGNAAAMDVYKFLSLTLNDGKTVLHHLEERSSTIKELFSDVSSHFDEICDQFLAIKNSNHQEAYTSAKIKQVYFPVSDSYYLLSILTPSGLVYEMKSRINEMHFSEKTKLARELKRKNQLSEDGFDEIYNLTTIGYGGTKPQNISVLNSANAGKAYLLPCVPPTLDVPHQRLPKKDFFSDILWSKRFFEYFDGIQSLKEGDVNNLGVREALKNNIQSIINDVLEEVWKIRSKTAWSFEPNYNKLHSAQKIWLDEARLDERSSNDAWFEEIAEQFTRWFVNAYKKRTKQLDGYDSRRFKEAVLENKENLI